MSRTRKIALVAGARPNFMKLAPLLRQLRNYPELFHTWLVHTGQHYDANMSQVFFDELDMPRPDEFLNVGSGSHADQTARTMLGFEPVVLNYRPDWVMVVGDVNSTLACALVCSKLGVRVAHVEAGLRSGDRTMPEEINRVVTDQIADALFTPSRDADENLLREGIPDSKIHFVGNVMIDTLVKMLPKALKRPTLANLGLEAGDYVLATLHRPCNVDDPAILEQILVGLGTISERMPVVLPVHPRTRQTLDSAMPILADSRVRLLDPCGYLDFLALTHSARLVITDSGGIQEETTYLGVPCLTVRPNTERPITVERGTNRLVGNDPTAIVECAIDLMSQKRKASPRLEYWDGIAANRIVRALAVQHSLIERAGV